MTYNQLCYNLLGVWLLVALLVRVLGLTRRMNDTLYAKLQDYGEELDKWRALGSLLETNDNAYATADIGGVTIDDLDLAREALVDRIIFFTKDLVKKGRIGSQRSVDDYVRHIYRKEI